MKITNVTVHLLKATGASRIFDLVLLPGMRRDRWKHDLVSMEPGVMPVMRVETDEGIVGACTADAGAAADLNSASLQQLRYLVVGKDPLDRERLYQALHTGTRWLYQPPGWLGSFDNCLWDILGKAAGLPVYSLIGRVREKTPVYMNIRGETKEEAADDARKAVAEGFPPLKDHFYHSVRENSSGSRPCATPSAPASRSCTTLSESTRSRRPCASGGRWTSWTTAGSRSPCRSASTTR